MASHQCNHNHSCLIVSWWYQTKAYQLKFHLKPKSKSWPRLTRGELWADGMPLQDTAGLSLQQDKRATLQPGQLAVHHCGGLIETDTDPPPTARHSCTSHLMSHPGCQSEAWVIKGWAGGRQGGCIAQGHSHTMFVWPRGLNVLSPLKLQHNLVHLTKAGVSVLAHLVGCYKNMKLHLDIFSVQS